MFEQLSEVKDVLVSVWSRKVVLKLTIGKNQTLREITICRPLEDIRVIFQEIRANDSGQFVALDSQTNIRKYDGKFQLYQQSGATYWFALNELTEI